MIQEKILVSNLVDSHLAISAFDGNKVFEVIKKNIENKTKTDLDFNGIELTITAFLNSSIGKLYSIYSSEEIKQYLHISNLKKEEVGLLALVITRAKARFNKEYPIQLDNIDLVNEDGNNE